MSVDLQQELRETIEHTTCWAQRNYRYAHLVFGVSVLGSFVSSVLSATDYGDERTWLKLLTAALAALPAILLLINSTLRFEDRTRWFWRKTRMAERYYRHLRDNPNADVVKVSADYTAEAEKLEDEWPSMGTSPAQPSKQ